MGQLGHAHPNMTLGVYAHVMHGRDGERERLRARVNGANWAVLGSRAKIANSVSERGGHEMRSTMHLSGG
jgi:hypothetical protein